MLNKSKITPTKKRQPTTTVNHSDVGCHERMRKAISDSVNECECYSVGVCACGWYSFVL